MTFIAWLSQILGDTTVNSLLTIINTSLSSKTLAESFKSNTNLNDQLTSSLFNSLDKQIKLIKSDKIKCELMDVKDILKKEPQLVIDELLKINYDFNQLFKDNDSLYNIAYSISRKMDYSDNPEIIGRHIGHALINFYIFDYLEKIEPGQLDYITIKNSINTLNSIQSLEESIKNFKIENFEYHNFTHRKLEEIEKHLIQPEQTNTSIDILNIELKNWCQKQANYQLTEILYDENFTILDIYIPLYAFSYKLKDRFLDLQTLRLQLPRREEVYSTIRNVKTNGKPIIILGSPGMGKSTFTKWFLVEESTKNNTIIRIELKKFNFSGEFSKDLIKYLNEYISSNIHQSYFASLDVTIILDGLDEIKLNSFEEHENFINSVVSFNDIYRNIKVLLTSRVSILNNRICDFLLGCQIIYITPFSSKQTDEWITKWNALNGISHLTNKNNLEQEIFNQPLMLYLFFKMQRSNPVLIKEKLNTLEIYRQLIEWTNGNEKYITEDQLNLLQVFSIGNIELRTLLKEFNENLSLTMLTNGKDTITISEVLEKELLPTSINDKMLSKLNPHLEISKQKLSSILLINTNTTFVQSFEVVDFFEFDFVHKSFKEYLASSAIVRKLIDLTKMEQEIIYVELYKIFSTLKIIDNVEIFLTELLKGVNKNILREIHSKLSSFFSRELVPHTMIDSINTNHLPAIRLYFQNFKDITLRKMQCNLAECLISLLSFLDEFLMINEFDLKEDTLAKVVTIANSINYEFKFNPLGLINLESLSLNSIILNNATFDNMNLSNSEINNCDLSRSYFENVGIQNTTISHSNFNHCYFRNANLYRTKISFTNLKDTDLSYAILKNATLTYSDLTDSNLEFSDLRNANLSYTNLNRVNLGNTRLENAIFNGSNLEGLIIDSKTLDKYSDILKSGHNFELIDIVLEV
ncbi:pentapeptide repeat-containing protein [Paenibacillus illinoisensis]|uniref:pentapeptide repeat-containing protein n=1 Tax=Paenibacillus illinoisensis TaxID=59845 RepID=UPI003D994D45